MSSKSEKLAQRLQEIQKFVAERITQDATYAVVAKELVKIAESLQKGKLAVQIVSRYPTLTQALQKFLSTRENLAEFYQFKIANLPSKSQSDEPETTAVLIRQEISVSQTGQKQTRYKLSNSHKTIIGRHLQCQILLDDSLTLVSGHHAEVQLIPNPERGNSNPNWLLCDLNTRNGTYVNSKRLQGCQSLQKGDRITLAAPYISQSTPEFIFECESYSAYNDNEFYRQLADCDVLCLVVSSSQPLSTEEKQLIEKVSKTQLAKLVLVVDVPAPDGQTAQLSKINLSAIETWLKSQNLDNSLELAPLLLQPFYPNTQASTIAPSFQQELDNFAQSLEILLKRKPEDILLKRVATQMISQLAGIERVFDEQEEALKKEIQRDEEKLQELGREDLKEQTKKALKKASEDKDKFFKQVKLELNQSKAALLDVFSKKSISYKIHLSTEELKPYVINHEGDKYVQLKAESTQGTSDANTALTHLCYSTLSEWATKEWKQIYNYYAEGGLSEIFQKTYVTIKIIPSINIAKSSFQPNQKLDTQKIFQNSTVGTPCESRYRPSSLLEYTIKQIRTQTMQWMFIFGIIASFLGLVGIAQQGGRNKLILTSLSPIFIGLTNKPWLLAFVLTLILFPIFTYIGHTLQKENKSKLEEEAEKLRKNLCNHYQSFAKGLVEKIVQDFSMQLEGEEQRIKGAIETVGEQFTAYIAEVEKSQLIIKSSLEKRKVQQKSFEREKVELQKLKRL